ncbi:MAG: helix-turn-helix domain-containing protein [Acidimicrobiales bacterium]
MNASDTDNESEQASALAMRLGNRLRARRGELALTLAEVADRSGLSISYVSAVEKGVNLPSLVTLVKFADALDISIPAVLAAEGASFVRMGRLPRAAGAADLSHPKLQLKAQARRIAPGSRGSLELPTKDHDVFVFVLEGAITVDVGDMSSFMLKAGDAFDLRSALRLDWESPSGAVVVWTACPIRLG